MILYFLTRSQNIIGHVSNTLANGMYIHSDEKEDDIKTGSQTLEFTLSYDKEMQERAEDCVAIGNSILIGNAAESYTVVETEQNWFGREILVYAESSGLNLLNMQLGSYTAPTTAHTIKWYFSQFFGTTEWKIGINELTGIKLKLDFDEESGTSRLQNLVSAFGGEFGYSFEFDNTKVTARLINIYSSRGTGNIRYLTLGKEIVDFRIKRKGTDLATAIKATNQDGLNLSGKTYDDGDMYLSAGTLYSRSALAEWGQDGAHIVRSYKYETSSKAKLLTEAKRQLAADKAPKVEYEAKTADGFMDLAVGDEVIIQELTGRTAYRTRVINIIRHEDADMLDVTFGDYVSLISEEAEE